MTQTDIIIIGSGIGGFSCAALLAHYGFNVIVCESHNLIGGAVHSFEYNGFTSRGDKHAETVVNRGTQALLLRQDKESYPLNQE